MASSSPPPAPRKAIITELDSDVADLIIREIERGDNHEEINLARSEPIRLPPATSPSGGGGRGGGGNVVSSTEAQQQMPALMTYHSAELMASLSMTSINRSSSPAAGGIRKRNSREVARYGSRHVVGAMGTSAILPAENAAATIGGRDSGSMVNLYGGLPARRVMSHDLLGTKLVVGIHPLVEDGNDKDIINLPPLTETPEMTIERKITVEFRALSTLVSETMSKRTQGVSKMTVADPAAQQYLDTDYHLIEIEELLAKFESNKTGLNTSQISRLQKKYGLNSIKPVSESIWHKLFRYLLGGFCPLMWVSSIICFIAWKPIGDPPDPMNLALGILLLIVIMCQAGFTAYQDWSTGQVMNSINNMLPASALVLRDGQRQVVDAIQIVPGDVVCLTLGDKVPADLRLISVSPDLKFDRSILTGEPDAVPGTLHSTDSNFLESQNIAMMGTYVTDGSGIGLCVSIGDHTVMGKIAIMSSSREQEPTLLQIEIARFVKIIACLSICTSAMTLILWGAWLKQSYPDFESLAAALVNAIAVLVAFTPEGLPIAVTLTLTVVARQMQRQMLLCKNLSVIDTLGSISVLCSDKTGTLTQNRMTVVNVGFLESDYRRHTIRKDLKEGDIGLLQSIRLAAGMCNDATFEPGEENSHLPVEQRKVTGQATDAALLRFAEEFDSVSDDQTRFETLFELPFNSKNKFMLKMLKPKLPYAGYDPETCVMFVKGGPDVLLGKCTHILGSNGRRVRLDEANNLSRLIKLQETWSSLGQRCLLLTQRILTGIEFPVSEIEPWAMEELVSSKVEKLTVIGLLGIVDPPRPEIREVINVCRKANIRIFMVTGDFALTAQAIAKDIGLITHDKVDCYEDIVKGKANLIERRHDNSDFNSSVNALCLTGNDLRMIEDHHWDSIVNYSEIVFARTTPEQKLKIVAEFKARGCIVGVTGDGVNDTPALKAANVGIAMGGGSDVAMEAADMVFLDNNFSSITVAIESGRLVFDNIKKVIVYLIPAGTFAELVPILTSIFLGVPLPLSAFLMICVCVLTDMGPSLCLMYEKPEADIMGRVPRNPQKDRLVDFKVFGQVYFFIGLIETFFAHWMYFEYLSRYGGIRFTDVVFAFDRWTDGFMGKTQTELNELQWTGQSIYFVTLVILQWGNIFCARTRKLSVIQQNPFFGPTRNLRLLLAIFIDLAIALIITETPGINDVFYSRSVPWAHWLFPIALAVILLSLEELRKYIVRKRPDGFLAKIAW